MNIKQLETLNLSLLKLFNGLYAEKHNLPKKVLKKDIKNYEEITKKTMQKWYIFNSEILYSWYNTDNIINFLNKYFSNNTELNSTFHKNWKIISKKTENELKFEQIMSYLYAYYIKYIAGILWIKVDFDLWEHQDIKNTDFNITELKKITINFYTKEEIKKELLILLNGVALKEDTLKEILNISQILNLFKDKDFFNNIKNKEFKVMVYDELKTMPEKVDEFLRYLIYKALWTTLLINNIRTFNMLSDLENTEDNEIKIVEELLNKYIKQYWINNLSRNFHRYKNIFLWIKHISENTRKIVNKIKRNYDLKWKKRDKMPIDYIGSFIKLSLEWKKITEKDLKKALENVNMFRKIKLLQALKYKLNIIEDKNQTWKQYNSYFIRNWKLYVKDIENVNTFYKKIKENKFYYETTLNVVKEDIIKELRKKVEWKNILLDKNIIYWLPDSEKKFLGNFPFGTKITIDQNNDNYLSLGVLWKAYNSEEKADIDVSILDTDNNKIWWNWNQKVEIPNEKIYFSGDVVENTMTMLKDEDNNKYYVGAEYLLFKKIPSDKWYVLYTNLYAGPFDKDIDTSIMIWFTKELHKNYILKKDEIFLDIKNIKYNDRQKERIFWLLRKNNNKLEYLMFDTVLWNWLSAVSRKSEIENSLIVQSIFSRYNNMITFNEILEYAGANLIYTDEKEKLEDVVIDYDLTVNNIDKTSFIKLLAK